MSNANTDEDYISDNPWLFDCAECGHRYTDDFLADRRRDSCAVHICQGCADRGRFLRDIVKRCSCGDTYTIGEWHTEAKYRGAVPWDGDLETELRDCGNCGSTIGLLVDRQTKWPETEAQDESNNA